MAAVGVVADMRGGVEAWLNPPARALWPTLRDASGEPHLISGDPSPSPLPAPSSTAISNSVSAVPTESTVHPLDPLDLLARDDDDAGDAPAASAHDGPPPPCPPRADSANASLATPWKKLSASSYAVSSESALSVLSFEVVRLRVEVEGDAEGNGRAERWGGGGGPVIFGGRARARAGGPAGGRGDEVEVEAALEKAEWLIAGGGG